MLQLFSGAPAPASVCLRLAEPEAPTDWPASWDKSAATERAVPGSQISPPRQWQHRTRVGLLGGASRGAFQCGCGGGIDDRLEQPRKPLERIGLLVAIAVPIVNPF